MVVRVVQGVLIALVVFVALDAAAGQRRLHAEWGRLEPVVVASADVATGTQVDDAALFVVERPTGAVPADALERLPEAGDRLVAPLLAGDVVRDRDVASGRARIDVPPGTRIVGVPRTFETPLLRAGDQVDVILLADPVLGGVHEPVVLDAPATVMSVDDDIVSVAVRTAQVVDVTATLAIGRVALALR